MISVSRISLWAGPRGCGSSYSFTSVMCSLGLGTYHSNGKVNDPKKHHYVPRFYLRQFCSVDHKNKVPTVSRHNPFLIKNLKSISGIGYEDNLYKVKDKDIEHCIEKTK